MGISLHGCTKGLVLHIFLNADKINKGTPGLTVPNQGDVVKQILHYASCHQKAW